MYFRLSNKADELGRPADRYFMPHMVSTDPRLTNYWMAFATQDAKTLWQAVERAALTQNFPGLTKAIVEHMIACGVVEKEFTKMTVDDIRFTMIRYTNIALAHALRETRHVVGDAMLTPEKVTMLRNGDVIESYDFYRFGPLPEVANKYEIVDRKGDVVVLTNVISDDTVELSIKEVSEWQFAALRKK